MTNIRERLKADHLLPVFTISIFIIDIWVVVHMFWHLPAWILQMNIWELAVTISFMLAYALVEGLIMFMAAVLLGQLLPSRIYREKFSALGIAFVIAILLWSAIYYYGNINILVWRTRQYLMAGALIAAITAVYLALISYFPKAQKFLLVFTQRISILAFLYLFFNLAGLLVVIFQFI